MYNIPLHALYKLPPEEMDKYLNLISVLKPLSKIGRYKATPLFDLTYGEVKEVESLLLTATSESISQAFKYVFKMPEKVFYKLRAVTFLKALNHLFEDLKSIAELEKNLIPKPDPIFEMAGADRLSIFGHFALLKRLAEKFKTPPQGIEDWKYSVVYAVLLHDKIYGEVEQEYNQLKYGTKGKA